MKTLKSFVFNAILFGSCMAMIAAAIIICVVSPICSQLAGIVDWMLNPKADEDT